MRIPFLQRHASPPAKPPRKHQALPAGGKTLRHAIIINVAYPTPHNGRGKYNVPEMPIAAVTLPLLAAITRSLRPDCNIRIYDELGTPVDMDYVDGLPREETLIMLSVRTTLAYEARMMALRFQGMGFAVVMGGPHVSSCIEEVVQYANAAVHGEAEIHLPGVISAFESGNIKAATLPGLAFKVDYNCDLTASPAPELHLYCHSRSYMYPAVLEFSRGCQYRCSFCASTNLYARERSYKTPAQVLGEIAMLPVIGGARNWFFGDDNFTTSHARTRELCAAIAREFPDAKWGCSITASATHDLKLLDALAQAGCRYVFVGFDSILQTSLDATLKGNSKAHEHVRSIAELRKRGIFVVGALIFGFDTDHKTVFRDSLSWALASGVDTINLNVIRPYPNTPNYAELQKAGRLLHDPWWMQPQEVRMSMVNNNTYNMAGVMTTFKPKNMTAGELTDGTLWVGQEFYRLKRMAARVTKRWQDPVQMFWEASINHAYRAEYRSHRAVHDPAAS